MSTLKDYLKGLIVDHGITDLDSLGGHELSKLLEFVDIQDDLMSDDDYIALMGSTDWYNCTPTYFIDRVSEMATPLIKEQIRDLFDELLVANRPEDNSHEDAERTPEDREI